MATAEPEVRSAVLVALAAATETCVRTLEPTLGRLAAECATLEFAACAVARSRGVSRADALALCAALRPRGVPELLGLWASSFARAEAALTAGLDGIDDPGALGDAYEVLLAGRTDGSRKRRGSYFTPTAVARRLVVRALDARGPGASPPRVVLDPAMGAGRFLLEALAHATAGALHGMDTDPVAVWLARVSVALASGARVNEIAARLRVGDALAPGAFDGITADLVVGNPPWVAHAGRQSVTLSVRDREDYRARFSAFAGFPTTHGMFLEIAARALAPGGALGLLVPTQVADLAGYGPARQALTARARVLSPVEELGFGQFDGVTEPTLALVAAYDPSPSPSAAPWALTERPSAGAPAVISPRAQGALARLADLPGFPPETFGEMGFQTAGELSRTHLSDWPPSDARFTVALREGRDIEAFFAGPPSRALFPEPAALAAARARLRPHEAYARVSVVIRQTARFPIAAVHEPPHAFRNSLLAGYHADPPALAALLNSALFRALHLRSQRDGRQAVFPQLKIAHLRALPAPPAGSDLSLLSRLAREAGDAQRARRAIDGAFRASAPRAPKGLFVPESDTVPARPEALARLGAGALGLAPAYERALEESRAAWARYRAAVNAIDGAVYTMYGVTEDERA